MKKMKKAEVSFFMESIYLILVLITISIVINQVFSLSSLNAREQENLKIKKAINDVLEILTASPACLAYEESGDIIRIDGMEKVKLATHRVIDIDKLRSFTIAYSEVEPECARNHEYRFKVEVEKFTISRTIEASEKWQFGIKTHSLDDALKTTVSGSTPVTIRMSDVKTQPGLITVTMYNGDLERLTGIIDRVCSTNTEISADVSLSYPTYVDAVKNSICMNYHQNDFCLKLSCDRQLEFTNVDAGNYKIRVVPIGNKIRVEV